MSKDKTPKSEYTCNACGAVHSKWQGQCKECQGWNTLVEQRAPTAATVNHRYAPLAASAPVTELDQVEESNFDRKPTGIQELDRVFGGGIVTGSVVLLAGDPGVGKSTLLLQAMDALSRQGDKVLYISGEESPGQVRMRSKRLGMEKTSILFQAEIQLERILQTIEERAPQIVVIDSIQTVWTDQLTSAPGGVSQIKECASQLTRVAKSTDTTMILVGHVTKSSELQGPRVLEHIVDVVAMFESNNDSTHRIIRAQKNRYGTVNEIGVFIMTETGLRSVTNPSAIFLSQHNQPVPGSCVMATVDGSRPLLCEIQALVDDVASPSPRRLTVGIDRDRLAMLLAVLNRHGAMQTSGSDIYVNAVGGLKITEPAADLAVLLAVQSSARNKALPKGLLVFGEVGLAGEVRPAPKGMDRLMEAVNLGFCDAIIPRANAPKKPIAGLTIHPVERIDQALQIARAM